MKALVLALLLPGAAWAACSDVPDPVHGLSVVSRYADGSNSTVIDTGAEKAAVEELKPVDDFIRTLAQDADDVIAGDPTKAACVLDAMQVWAEAGALATLATDTSKITIGSRIAGLALAARKVRASAPNHPGWPAITAWLTGLVHAQRVFWEEDAPSGTKRGNLRAWAALGGAAVADLTDDPVTRGWAVWSATYVLCTANPDGSLPQEMTRGKHSLHYQLHAIAPLVVTAALMRRHNVDLMSECDGALARAAQFAMNDLTTGDATQVITGKVQSFFDGSRTLGGHQLAWVEAYLAMLPDAGMDAMVQPFRPLSNSKLGGDQTLAWGI